MMPSFNTGDWTVEVSRRWVASDVGRLRQRWSNASQRMKARRKKTSEPGEKTRWYDFLDIFTLGEDFGVIAVILGIVLALVLVWFVALPLLVPVVGLLGQLAWLLILIPIVFIWKVLGRRPWMVDATSQEGLRIATWKVTGWFASGRLEREIVASGAEGIPVDTIRPDLQIAQPG